MGIQYSSISLCFLSPFHHPSKETTFSNLQSNVHGWLKMGANLESLLLSVKYVTLSQARHLLFGGWEMVDHLWIDKAMACYLLWTFVPLWPLWLARGWDVIVDCEITQFTRIWNGQIYSQFSRLLKNRIINHHKHASWKIHTAGMGFSVFLCKYEYGRKMEVPASFHFLRFTRQFFRSKLRSWKQSAKGIRCNKQVHMILPFEFNF